MSRSADVSLSRQDGANRSRNVASWRVPLRRARRAIRSTLDRVETCSRVIEATVRFAAGRPLETSRRIRRLSNWIDEAGACLQRASRGVGETVRLAEKEPDRAAAAPALLFDTTGRWLDAAERLNEISVRLVETSARLVHDARSRGVVPADAPAQPVPSRPAHFRHAPVVLIRRRWLIIAFCVEVARKISRGRAPPSDSSAHSYHRD
jgi:hypothetical protein